MATQTSMARFFESDQAIKAINSAFAEPCVLADGSSIDVVVSDLFQEISGIMAHVDGYELQIPTKNIGTLASGQIVTIRDSKYNTGQIRSQPDGWSLISCVPITDE